MADTQIDWCDKVWNPVTGCSKVSTGCKNCYAERMAKRLAGRAGYPAENPFAVTLHPDRLNEPLRWRKPRRVFVCSMGDLFHADVPDGFIFRVWQTMAATPWHTYQVLTKRPERMAEFTGVCAVMPPFALPNVWLGVSVEDQATADERIPHLLRCPAAVRFVSYEPALGPVDFDGDGYAGPGWLRGWHTEAEHDPRCDGSCSAGHCPVPVQTENEKLDWIIAGGESGPHARPAHPDWFRSVRDQCKAAGVAFFMKQITERGRKVPFESWPVDLQVREWPKGGERG